MCTSLFCRVEIINYISTGLIPDAILAGMAAVKGIKSFKAARLTKTEATVTVKNGVETVEDLGEVGAVAKVGSTVEGVVADKVDDVVGSVVKGNGANVSIDNQGFDTTRINIAKGPTRFSPSKNADQFTITVDELKSILGKKEIIKIPGVPSTVSGQYTRIVNVGETVGNIKPSLPEIGGKLTTWITIITDIKGNLITTYPSPAPN